MNNNRIILEQIIKDDPDNLLKIDLNEDSDQDITLIESFNEINNFYEKYNKEPSANKIDFYEFQLYASLKNIREDSKKIKILSKYDKNFLLNISSKKIETLKDIFNDDPEGLLNEDKNGLFDLRGPIKEIARAKTDFVARRKPCKNFEVYKNNFNFVQNDLKEGHRQLIPFREFA